MERKQIETLLDDRIDDVRLRLLGRLSTSERLLKSFNTGSKDGYEYARSEYHEARARDHELNETSEAVRRIEWELLLGALPDIDKADPNELNFEILYDGKYGCELGWYVTGDLPIEDFCDNNLKKERFTVRHYFSGYDIRGMLFKDGKVYKPLGLDFPKIEKRVNSRDEAMARLIETDSLIAEISEKLWEFLNTDQLTMAKIEFSKKMLSNENFFALINHLNRSGKIRASNFDRVIFEPYIVINGNDSESGIMISSYEETPISSDPNIAIKYVEFEKIPFVNIQITDLTIGKRNAVDSTFNEIMALQTQDLQDNNKRKQSHKFLQSMYNDWCKYYQEYLSPFDDEITIDPKSGVVVWKDTAAIQPFHFKRGDLLHPLQG